MSVSDIGIKKAISIRLSGVGICFVEEVSIFQC
jgi:hypothetical protein